MAGALKREGGDLLVSGGPDEVLTLQGEHAAHLPVVTRSTLLLHQEWRLTNRNGGSIIQWVYGSTVNGNR